MTKAATPLPASEDSDVRPEGTERKPRYRPDIDGLRAIAVTSVVLFHADLRAVQSGFVGVDIFFTISGYLIGGIILRDTIQGRFRFSEFYARRARRILPALFVTVIAVLAAGWFVLGASEYYGVGATSLSALLATSNISFWRHQDYFSPDSNLEPLLMTWTLGIEEQFYLFFPFIILATARWLPRRVLAVLGLVTVGSFVFSMWCATTYPLAAFYLLPSRAWELGAGAFLAAFEIISFQTGAGKVATRFAVNYIGCAGLAALAVSIFCIPPQAPVPGVLTVLPVAGTLALIWSEGSMVNSRILASAPMVFIGMISYSWYLWHWPAMSYVRILSVGVPSTWLLVLIATFTFGIAVLSWRYVEQRFRRARLPPTLLLARYAVALAILVTVAGTIKYAEGLPQRLSGAARNVEAIIGERSGNCLATWTIRAPDLSSACVTLREGHPGIALIGDSHGAALGPGLREIASQRGWSFSILTKSACPPLLGANIPHERMPAFADDCESFMTNSFRYVTNSRWFNTVLLAAAWSGYRRIGQASFHDTLARSIATLRAAGKRVILVGDVPSWQINPTHFAFATAMPLRNRLARMLWFDRNNIYPRDGRSFLTEPIDPAVSWVLSQIARESGVELVSLRAVFCAKEGCLLQANGEFLYLDKHHLSDFGSHLAWRPLTKEVTDPSGSDADSTQD